MRPLTASQALDSVTSSEGRAPSPDLAEDVRSPGAAGNGVLCHLSSSEGELMAFTSSLVPAGSLHRAISRASKRSCGGGGMRGLFRPFFTADPRFIFRRSLREHFLSLEAVARPWRPPP